MDRPAPLIVITGPTGAGKTDIALKLAEDHPLEVISADSMQVYRHMDIATAKPSPLERRRLPHHLIDIRNPDEDFDAGQFMSAALSAIRDIRGRGRIPLVVGGTGLYIKALLYGLCPAPPRSEALRAYLRTLIARRGAGHLWNILERLDPKSAAILNPQDASRLIRYLEIAFISGMRPSELQAVHGFAQPLFEARTACIMPTRADLYARIDQRVLHMLACGLIAETEHLLNMGYHRQLKPMQTLAYKHICAHLDNAITLDEAVRLIQRDTRRYAKRQITWNRGHYEETCVYTPDDALSVLTGWINQKPWGNLS